MGDRGLEAFSNLSFQVNAGEIIGIAGVAGNGQRASRCDRRAQTFHQWFVVNERADITDASPQFRFRSGLAYIPEDRLGVGLAPRLSITDNAILRVYRQQRRRPFILAEKALAYCKDIVQRFGVRSADFNGPIGTLEGQPPTFTSWQRT